MKKILFYLPILFLVILSMTSCQPSVVVIQVPVPQQQCVPPLGGENPCPCEKKYHSGWSGRAKTIVKEKIIIVKEQTPSLEPPLEPSAPAPPLEQPLQQYPSNSTYANGLTVAFVLNAGIAVPGRPGCVNYGGHIYHTACPMPTNNGYRSTMDRRQPTQRQEPRPRPQPRPQQQQVHGFPGTQSNTPKGYPGTVRTSTAVHGFPGTVRRM